MTARHRVVQWSTGTVGERSLRAVIQHPDLQLVGVHVSDPEKVGRDAGDLCGCEPTGIRAMATIDDVLDSRPDCVLYMPLFPDVDTICRLLEAGVNVVTTCGLFHHPAGIEPALRHRVDRACAAGSTSLHSTGSSPGFISEALPLVAATLQRELRMLVINEYADLSRRDSPELIFDVMGFGAPMGRFADIRSDYLRSSFGPSLSLVADAIGLPLEHLHATGELAATPTSVEIAAGTLQAGTVAGQRVTVTGFHDGRALLSFCATWYCTHELAPAWDLRATGWHVKVDGDAPLNITVEMPIPLSEMAAVSPNYTANRAVNMVDAVCRAAPGLCSTVDLPTISPRLHLATDDRPFVSIE